MSTPDNRSVNFFSLFRRDSITQRRGRWKRCWLVFVENRVIKMTRYAIRFMPPIAVFTFCWQIALGGQLGPAVATALFALSLPMQGLWWLGKRWSRHYPLQSSTGFMKFAVNCRSLDRCWHPLKASLITRH